ERIRRQFTKFGLGVHGPTLGHGHRTSPVLGRHELLDALLGVRLTEFIELMFDQSSAGYSGGQRRGRVGKGKSHVRPRRPSLRGHVPTAPAPHTSRTPPTVWCDGVRVRREPATSGEGPALVRRQVSTC